MGYAEEKELPRYWWLLVPAGCIALAVVIGCYLRFGLATHEYKQDWQTPAAVTNDRGD